MTLKEIKNIDKEAVLFYYILGMLPGGVSVNQLK